MTGSDRERDVEALAALIVADTDEPMWSACVIAKRILASDWLAAHDKAVAAEALRDAARDLPGFESVRTHGDAARWLRDRADGEED